MKKLRLPIFTLIFFKVFLFATTAKATNYYVDPSSTASSENGSLNAPWKSINSVNKNVWRFVGGDNIYFKKGQSFKGALVIYQGGSDASHPVTYSSYGSDAAMPLFQYDLNTSTAITDRTIIDISNSKYVVIDGINFTDLTMDAYNHNLLTHVANAINVSSSSYITIKNIKASLLGTGLTIIGNYNTVSNCTLENMRMTVSTSNMATDDYGAMGISLSGSYNTIQNNTIKDCWGASVKYTWDGGTVELRNSCNNNKIMYNTCINNEGFIETGTNNGGSDNNNVVAYNLMINLGRLFWINYGNSVGIPMNNLQFHNNNVIQTVASRSGYTNLIGVGPSVPSTSNMFNLKNNVFWINSGVNIAMSALSNGQIVHSNNIYKMGSGVLGFNIGSVEQKISSSTQVFNSQSSTDPTSWDYSLTSSSPAVDKGVNLSYSADFKGDKVYAGSAPDMGILESNSTSTTTSTTTTASTTSTSTQQLGFTSFSGYNSSGSNYLQWQTTNSPISSLKVERSNDGSSFYGIGSVSPKTGTTTYLDYSFVDGSPSNNLQYYRISAIQNGVVVNQSNVISFYDPALITQGISISPNPVVSSAYITLSGGATFINKGITVSNSSGQVVLKQSINQDVNQVSINFSSLYTGTYYLNVTDQNGVILYKATFAKN